MAASTVRFEMDEAGFRRFIGARGPVGEHMRRLARQVEAAAKAFVKVDRGILRASITYVIDEDAVGARALVGTGVVWGLYVHQGRRPGAKWPPSNAIEQWLLRRQGRATPSEVFLVRRAISRNGIASNPYLTDALATL